jgi:hypothetical protein
VGRSLCAANARRAYYGFAEWLGREVGLGLEGGEGESGGLRRGGEGSWSELGLEFVCGDDEASKTRQDKTRQDKLK